LGCAAKVFAYPAPAQRLDRLAELVATGLAQNVFDGALFLFVGRTRTSCKILHWDGTGLSLFSKRLERGRFAALWQDGGCW
jgi:transposase